MTLFSRWPIVQPGPPEDGGPTLSPRRLRRARLLRRRGRGARVAPGAWRCRRWLHRRLALRWDDVGYEVGGGREPYPPGLTSQGRVWRPDWLLRAQRVLRGAA